MVTIWWVKHWSKKRKKVTISLFIFYNFSFKVKWGVAFLLVKWGVVFLLVVCRYWRLTYVCAEVFLCIWFELKIKYIWLVGFFLFIYFVSDEVVSYSYTLCSRNEQRDLQLKSSLTSIFSLRRSSNCPGKIL